MQRELKNLILEIMDDHRIMTVAVLRPDGYPQATTVSFAHDGFKLYFVCGNDSQKADNLQRNGKVSVTIDADHEDFLHIKGLSLTGDASEVTSEREIQHVYKLLEKRYPEMQAMPAPKLDEVKVFMIEPKVISVLDYSKGLGHTEQIEIDAGERGIAHRVLKHDWHLFPGKRAGG